MSSNEYMRHYYAMNRDKLQHYAAIRRRKLRDFIANFKNVPCKDCNLNYPPYVMDFDHLRDKLFTISPRSQCDRKKLLDEIAKCEVVCANCHRMRTQQRLKINSLKRYVM